MAAKTWTPAKIEVFCRLTPANERVGAPPQQLTQPQSTKPVAHATTIVVNRRAFPAVVEFDDLALDKTAISNNGTRVV